MSVVPVLKDLHVAEETTILIPKKIDNTDNVQREKNSNWSEYNRVLRYSLILVAINLFVLTYLFMIPTVQMIAWEDELRNITNSTTVIQYEPIQESLLKCLLITCLIIQVLFVTIIGLDTMIKSFPEITLIWWIFTACLTIIIIVIVYYVNIPIDIFTKNISKKMVFNTVTNGNPILTLPQDGHLPPGIYYSYLCMLCMTILCNIQHIIIIFLIIKIRPKTIDHLNKNKNSSNSLSYSSTAQTQKNI